MPKTLDEIVAAHKRHVRDESPMSVFADMPPPEPMSSENPFTETVELDGDPIRMNDSHIIVKTDDGRLLSGYLDTDLYDDDKAKWVWSDITPREDENGNIVNE